MPNKTFLRNYYRRYFNAHMSQYSKELRTDSFLLNMGLNYCKHIFLEDFLLNGNDKDDFESFFNNVFKDKIELIKC